MPRPEAPIRIRGLVSLGIDRPYLYWWDDTTNKVTSSQLNLDGPRQVWSEVKDEAGLPTHVLETLLEARRMKAAGEPIPTLQL
jgi:hypothetical protein